ncbi:putative trans-sialidase, partial [Trypanosoma cruzi]
RRSLPSSHPVCVLLLFSVGDGFLCRPFRFVSCPALCVGALLCSPLTCLVYCRCCCILHFLNRHARKERKQARIVTVKFEVSESSNNSTHTAHTYIYMLSRVAAVMAPRTHNRRRVTGSSGRRREGRESEQQRPNMSRRVSTSAVLLLLVVMVCCATCGASTAVKSNSGAVQLAQEIDIFVPMKKRVV